MIHNQIEYDNLTDNTNYQCIVTLNFTSFANIIDSQHFTQVWCLLSYDKWISIHFYNTKS